MKPPINLSVNPSYFCNFRCEFCYLTPQQLGDRTRLLSASRFDELLDEVTRQYEIKHVDLYGGEVSLLPYAYVSKLKKSMHERGIRDINLNTNLSALNEVTLDPDFSLSVSFDFEAREKYDHVLRNMALIDRPFSVLILASQKVLQLSVEEMVWTLNSLSNLRSVEIKPYSTNQANQHNVSFLAYEEFIKQWLECELDFSFEFINQVQLEKAVTGQLNSYSDDHIYITPSGKFAVLEFDLNDNEYFLELDSIEDYIAWTEKEKARVARNKFCGSCHYKGRCLSEHLREVKDLDHSCNGFYHLMRWYERAPD